MEQRPQGPVGVAVIIFVDVLLLEIDRGGGDAVAVAARSIWPVNSSVVSPDQPNQRPRYSLQRRRQRHRQTALARPSSLPRLGRGDAVGDRRSGGSSDRAPGSGQQHSAVDDADKRIGLRIVSPQLAGRETVSSDSRPAGVRRWSIFVEELARLVVAADQVQGLDEPEGAEVERGLGLAEIVLARRSGAYARRGCSPFSMASKVAMTRRRAASRKRRSSICSRQASSSSLPKLAAKRSLVLEPGLLLDPLADRWRRGRARMPRALGEPQFGGMLASRSQAAQHITEL